MRHWSLGSTRTSAGSVIAYEVNSKATEPSQYSDMEAVAEYRRLVTLLRWLAILPRVNRDKRRQASLGNTSSTRAGPVLVLLLLAANMALRQFVWRVSRPQAEDISNMFVIIDLTTIFNYAGLMYLFRSANMMLFRRMVKQVASLPFPTPFPSGRTTLRRLVAISGVFAGIWTLAMLGIVYIYQSALDTITTIFYLTRVVDLSLPIACAVSPWCIRTYLRFHQSYAERLAEQVRSRRLLADSGSTEDADDSDRLRTKKGGENSSRRFSRDAQLSSRESSPGDNEEGHVVLPPPVTSPSAEEEFQGWLLEKKQELRGYLQRARHNTAVLLNFAILLNSAQVIYIAEVIVVLLGSQVALKEVFATAGAVGALAISASLRPLLHGRSSMQKARQEFQHQFNNVLDAVVVTEDGDDDSEASRSANGPLNMTSSHSQREA